LFRRRSEPRHPRNYPNTGPIDYARITLPIDLIPSPRESVEHACRRCRSRPLTRLAFLAGWSAVLIANGLAWYGLYAVIRHADGWIR
jgi:hypothetical protein